MHEKYGATPVKTGQELEVSIESQGAKGDGVAKHQRFTIFVPNTKVGDMVKVRVTKVMEKFAFAEVVETISEAPEEQP